MTIVEMGRALRARQVSCVELVERALRAEARERDRLNAFITVTGDAALTCARELDEELAKGVDRGPLHGIPIAHKDAFPTSGVRTTCGSKLLADWVPDYDAALVSKLDTAGAVSIGKTNLHELCYGITSTNPHYGAVRNPHDVERIPGGSSGGSAAAVAVGIVPLATGTDTGGSVRIPASFCGVVGLKATYEAIDRSGCLPLGFTFDHVGPITRTAEDAELVFGVLTGARPAAPQRLRIGLPEKAFFQRLHPEVRFSVRQSVQALAAMGAEARDTELPDVDALIAVGRFALMAELASVWGSRAGDPSMFGEDVYNGIRQGLDISAREYIDAQRVRHKLAREFACVWDDFDVLITPATPIPAPKIGETTVAIGGIEEDLRVAVTRCARPFNVLGWPAISVPCGTTKSGLPIGVQIIGPPGGEASIFAAARMLETVRPYRIAERPL